MARTPSGRGIFGTLILIFGFTYAAAWDGVPGKPYEGWPKLLLDVPPGTNPQDGPNPSTAHYKDFVITVKLAADQSAGGSGGRVFDVEVRNKKTGKSLTFEDQMIAERLLEFYHGFPQVESWGRGGGGTYSRVLWRVENGKYVTVRDDLFDINIHHALRKDVTATLPGEGDTLYYTGTMYPTPGTGE